MNGMNKHRTPKNIEIVPIDFAKAPPVLKKAFNEGLLTPHEGQVLANSEILVPHSRQEISDIFKKGS